MAKRPARKPEKPRPKRPADEAAALLAERRGDWTDRALIVRKGES